MSKKEDHCFECERPFSETRQSIYKPLLCVLCAMRLLFRERDIEELEKSSGENDGTAAKIS